MNGNTTNNAVKDSQALMRMGFASKGIDELSKFTTEQKYLFLQSQIESLKGGSSEMAKKGLGNISNLMCAFEDHELQGREKIFTGAFRAVSCFISRETEAAIFPAWLASHSIIHRSGILLNGALGKEMRKNPGEVTFEMLCVVADKSVSPKPEIASAAKALTLDFVKLRQDFVKTAEDFSKQDTIIGEAAGLLLGIMREANMY